MNFKNILELIKFKSKYILINRQIVLAPLFSILIVIIYKSILKDDIESVLQIGLLFNITLSSIMMTCIPLAEDKEKKTLKTLMISTVSSIEYIIASIVSPLLIVSVVNIVILVITKPLFSSTFHLIVFLVICTLSIVISEIIGFIIGLSSKNQSQASMIAAPTSMVLIFIPFMANFLQNDKIISMSSFIYTNVIMSLVSDLEENGIISLTINEVLSLTITFLAGFYLAIRLYQENLKKG